MPGDSVASKTHFKDFPFHGRCYCECAENAWKTFFPLVTCSVEIDESFTSCDMRASARERNHDNVGENLLSARSILVCVMWKISRYLQQFRARNVPTVLRQYDILVREGAKYFRHSMQLLCDVCEEASWTGVQTNFCQGASVVFRCTLHLSPSYRTA